LPSAFQYGDWEWSSDNFGIDAALKQAIPNAVVIPALKSIDEEMKSTQTSTFGKLLSKIIMPKVKASTHYSDLTSSFSNLVMQLKSEQSIEGLRELRNDLTSRISEIIDARLILSLQEPEYDKVLGGIAELRLDDGKETPISLQGHGLQRSLIFCLLEIIAKHDSLGVDGGDGNISNRSVVLLYEEPELFIHPHLMRKLKKVLESISNSHSWQVAITTHSPYLVNVANNPRSLVVLKKESTQPPVIVQLESDPFVGDDKARLRAALDYHPTVCEAFFAKRSILVEGDTEVAMFSEAERLVNVFNVENSLHSETTIVSCGGKWTISAIAKIMTNLGLPYKVIHDRDQKDIDLANLDQVSAIHPYKANSKIAQSVGNAGNIYVVADTMEDVLWPNNRPGHKSDKPFKAWQRLKDIMLDIETEPRNISNYNALREIIVFSYQP
jgi:predicted ATP-dependent endonuclease of OLD family